MSLPIPSTGGNSRSNTATPPLPSHPDSKQMQAMDAPLIALTQRCNGDMRQVLFAFFSFLNRRTDFYLVPHPEDEGISKMGFAEGDAEKILLAAFRQFPLRRIPKGTTAAGGDRIGGGGVGGGGDPPQKSGPTTTTTTTTPANTPIKAERFSEDQPSMSSIETTSVTAVPNLTQQPSNDNSDGTTTSSSSHVGDDPHDEYIPSNMKGVVYNEENRLQIPVGNGGSTPRYKWTQTLEEISVLIGIPKNLHGKDLDVLITCSKLSVKSKYPLPGQLSPHVFLEGSLTDKIRADESTWTVEGGVIIVTLDKLKKTFWSTVIVGDEKIDTELVDSRRHISDYDEATQAQLRKIIFDQTQYHKGLPSSDEILGRPSKIPPLPAGVEYIDKKKLDAVDGGKRS